MQPQDPYQPPQEQPSAPPQQPYSAQPQAAGAPGQMYAAPSPTTVAPIDYLNQIAVPTHSKKFSPLVVFGLIGGVIVAAAIALFVFSAVKPCCDSKMRTADKKLIILFKISSLQCNKSYFGCISLNI